MTIGRSSFLWAAVFGGLFLAVEVLGLALSKQYSIYEIVWVRYGVHLTIVILILCGSSLLLRLHKVDWRLQILRSLLALAMPTCWFWAIVLGVEPAALAAGLATGPFLVALILQFVPSRHANSNLWFGACLSGVGALLIGFHYAHSVAAVLLPLAAGLCLALYIVATEQLQDEVLRVNLFHTAFWVFLVLTPAQYGNWITPPLRDLLIMVAIGVAGLGALFALDLMTRQPGYAAATVLINLQILPSVGIPVLRGHGMPPLMVTVGLLLMVTAAVVAWKGQSFAKSTEKRYEPIA